MSLEARRWRPCIYAVVSLLALATIFWAYGPALHGPFVFDDKFILRFAMSGPTESVITFARPDSNHTLSDWIRASHRPVLNFSYWLNHQIYGSKSFSYHVTNIIIHSIAAGLVFLILRRLLQLADARKSRINLVASFGAAVFLLHPVQAEAVAYLAGRSESLSVMLAFTAFSIFLYRRDGAISWRVSIAVVAFLSAAMLCKEQTIALALLLPFTDIWWNARPLTLSIRLGWRLYALLALGTVAGLAFFWREIIGGNSAGLTLQDFTWYQYLFTECRALFIYPREFLIPAGLNADWDFPISSTILDHGSIFGLLALVALVTLAVVLRHRFPLATYGFLTYLLLMAPTSSILPIRDPIADRRLYFGMLGLLTITADVLARLRVKSGLLASGCAALVLLAAGATRMRTRVWGDEVTFWEDVVTKSPRKARAHLGLAFAYFDKAQYELAVAQFERTAHLQQQPNALVLEVWGLAYDEMNLYDDALDKLHASALASSAAGASRRTAEVYSHMGMIYGKQSRFKEALGALAEAERLNPSSAITYLYCGNIDLLQGRVQDAVQNYQHALALDPSVPTARKNLAIAQARLRNPY